MIFLVFFILFLILLTTISYVDYPCYLKRSNCPSWSEFYCQYIVPNPPSTELRRKVDQAVSLLTDTRDYSRLYERGQYHDSLVLTDIPTECVIPHISSSVDQKVSIHLGLDLMKNLVKPEDGTDVLVVLSEMDPSGNSLGNINMEVTNIDSNIGEKTLVRSLTLDLKADHTYNILISDIGHDTRSLRKTCLVVYSVASLVVN